MKRGLGEAGFLQPLFERLEKGKDPAENMLACYEDGGIASVIDRFVCRLT